MVDRQDIGSWLSGPPRGAAAGGSAASASTGKSSAESAAESSGQSAGEYPGARLGLPRVGVGAIAPLRVRLLALVIDWVLVCVIAAALVGYRPGDQGARSFAPTLVFLVMNVLMVGTAGWTVGHRLAGLQVLRTNGGYAGPLPGLIRSVLLALGVPALLYDKDQRGLHDRLAGTMIVRAR